MFQWDAVVTSPDLGVKMSSKPSEWLFNVKGGRRERNWREYSVAGFIFTYVQKYFGSLKGEGDRPHHPIWVRHCWNSVDISGDG